MLLAVGLGFLKYVLVFLGGVLWAMVCFVGRLIVVWVVAVLLNEEQIIRKSES